MSTARTHSLVVQVVNPSHDVHNIAIVKTQSGMPYVESPQGWLLGLIVLWIRQQFRITQIVHQDLGSIIELVVVPRIRTFPSAATAMGCSEAKHVIVKEHTTDQNTPPEVDPAY